jgi:hypothetical protein
MTLSENIYTPGQAPEQRTRNRIQLFGAALRDISSVGISQVWSNDQPHFADVPESTWGTSIGGYQPAQKWLKIRVGRRFTFDDIRHYQSVIVALSETGMVTE